MNKVPPKSDHLRINTLSLDYEKPLFFSSSFEFLSLSNYYVPVPNFVFSYNFSVLIEWMIIY
ncbi:hypothetical protein RhiirC2_75539 [Rhizophagus irregularis]|uniref:Uncharacterized protein n=1 Tax=Rhizophagus irregularis TaxID=588596 RepID=A0A2N1NU65_9GLOM|nr:hypothetical protein RhiirC2_75539 [Rhizophagus irregularis]